MFVLGKGGVGRSTIAASLAEAYVQKGQKVLVVQWALADVVGRWFGNKHVGHKETAVSPNLFVMNFDSILAIREYFVDHLKMGLVHKMVIENRHVQKLVQAAPGLHELFFLGRLFWLESLALQERGWQFDRIIVDSPATGHSVSLFQLAKTMASYGFTGPLAYECERVAKMLADEKRTGALVVTIPEELPVEETAQFIPSLVKEMGRPPLKLIINRSTKARLPSLADNVSFEESKVLSELKDIKTEPVLKSVYADLQKRQEFERYLENELGKLCRDGSARVDDLLLEPKPLETPRQIVDEIALRLRSSL